MYALSTLILSVIFIEIFTVSPVVADFVLSLILLTSITGVSESAFVLLTINPYSLRLNDSILTLFTASYA